ncbi:hypothetical protein [Dokdonella sp.]|uniref:hypothetical protein n=1 Tax=Dokdonella sp. TaxID=2291710 RepID=UPI0025C67709|nr:hypothetical protein [Dokdonella sp.]MBX3689068.1 hypothetical protein [Dokdonella sp.]
MSAGEATPAAQADAVSRAHADSTLGRLLPHLFDLLRREPALGLTAAYLLVAMAGLIYDYRFYAQFGIPILSLLQVGDFLTAGVQEPMALLLVLSTLPLIWLFDRFNVWLRMRMRKRLAEFQALPGLNRWQRTRRTYFEWQLKRRDNYMRLMYGFILFGYGWTFVAIYADHRVEQVRRGHGPQVQVWMAGGEHRAAADGGPLTYLGAVSAYLFVLDTGTQHVQILPAQAISRLEPVQGSKLRKGNALVPNP